jgi:hypothetical protein
LALTSPTSGGRSVGMIRWWAKKAPEFFIIIISQDIYFVCLVLHNVRIFYYDNVLGGY